MTKISIHICEHKSLLIYLAVFSMAIHPLSLKAGPYTINWTSSATSKPQGTPPLVPGDPNGAIASLQNTPDGLKLSGYAYASSGLLSEANSYFGYDSNINRSFTVSKSGNISDSFFLKLTGTLVGQLYLSGSGTSGLTAKASVDGAGLNILNAPCLITSSDT